MDRSALVWVLVAAACAGSASSPAPTPPRAPASSASPASPDLARIDNAAPAPAPTRPIAIEASSRITWTRVASGALEPIRGQERRTPLLARALHGRVFAAVVKSDEITLRIVRTEEQGKHDAISLADDLQGRDHLAAIALDDRVAKVIVSATSGELVLATVDLATASVKLARFRVEGTAFISDIYRAGRGWVLIGSRGRDGGSRGDLVAWELADGATKMSAVTLVADPDCDYEATGISAPDGTIVLTAFPLSESCKRPQTLVLARRRGLWGTLRTPFTRPGARMIPTAGSQWLLDCLSCGDTPSVHAVDMAMARTAMPTELDATWAGQGRKWVRAVTAGSRVILFGGPEALPDDSAPLLLDSSRGPTSGAIYDLGRGTVRPFASPDLAQLPAARWSPALAIPIGDRLCLLGGHAASSAAPGGVDIHGAACLDPETLAWQWHAAPAELPLKRAGVSGGQTFVGSLCEQIGQVDATQTLVWCASRRSTSREVDVYNWGLWLVGLAR